MDNYCAGLQQIFGRVILDSSSPLHRSPVLHRAYIWLLLSCQQERKALDISAIAMGHCPWAKVCVLPACVFEDLELGFLADSLC